MGIAVTCMFDDATNTASYVVSDEDTNSAAIIDPVLDFDPVSGRVSTQSAENMLAHVRERNLNVEWILETHLHADHVTAAQFFREETGAKIGISRNIMTIHENIARIFGDEVPFDGSRFQVLFDDNATFSLGSTECRVVATPGHTPACVTYVVGKTCFVGDTLFMPDSGTARCDFPGGDARQLYASIQRILGLPDDTRVYVCHDYGAGGKRPVAWKTTIGEQRSKNIHVGGGCLEHDFVEMRRSRDGQLSLPRLFMAAMQFNLRGGSTPPPESNGTSYVRIPLNRF